MKLQLLMFLLIAGLLVSCVSNPPPAQAVEEPKAESGNAAFQARAQELVTGQSGGLAAAPATETATAPATQPATPAGSTASSETDTPQFVPGQLSPEEEAFLENHIARLQYMVYYDREVEMQASIAKAAVAQANRYLIDRLGRTVMDMDQLERLKADHQTAFQAETGGSIDIMQYLAQKYNADVYVEISLSTETELRNNVHYAQARGSMKMYDTSTGQLLGSVPFQSPQVRANTTEAAVANAVTASVWVGMPVMVEQSRNLIRGSMSNGVRYELIIQNPPDSRGMRDFRRALERYFRLVETASSSASEAQIHLYTFQTKSKVEDYIYDAADRAGLLDLQSVYSRGRSFVVNSGL